jgi:NADPH-dependent glutamate synthase beta subunit-like oxidoreductase
MESAGGARAELASEERSTVAPCSTRCPLGICIQGYAGHIAAGQYGEALELIMSRTPLPDSVCRVCHHPCEETCIHRESSEPVAINDLKRFVMGWAASQEESPYDPPREAPNGMKVAVVGAGPAGLTAAHDLRLRGYEVTVFDANQEPGGLLLTGIPRFRLPREALRRDVGRILGLGVAFVGNMVLGRNLNLADLLAQGNDAVFLALGARLPAGLEAASGNGRSSPSVVDALSYLAGSTNGPPPATGRQVLVVGGGNAAMDAARTALRRGAESVVVAYRRGREEMTALPAEIEAGEREGILLRTRLQPIELRRGQGGGLLCIRTEPGEIDATGRRTPAPVEGSDTLIEADQVILAVGQAPDLSFHEERGRELELAPDGSLRVDPETARTSHPKIFAGGDLVPGPRTVTQAISWGQRAAWGIDLALRGREAADRKPPTPPPEEWPAMPVPRRSDPLAMIGPPARERPEELPPEQRITGFEEVVGTLTEAQARAEAARCAACGQCGNCRACLDLFGCPAFYLDQGLIRIDPALCNGCGVCAHLCPNVAIRPAEGNAE